MLRYDCITMLANIFPPRFSSGFTVSPTRTSISSVVVTLITRNVINNISVIYISRRKEKLCEVRKHVWGRCCESVNAKNWCIRSWPWHILPRLPEKRTLENEKWAPCLLGTSFVIFASNYNLWLEVSLKTDGKPKWKLGRQNARHRKCNLVSSKLV